jgi:hypothetical protein
MNSNPRTNRDTEQRQLAPAGTAQVQTGPPSSSWKNPAAPVWCRRGFHFNRLLRAGILIMRKLID